MTSEVFFEKFCVEMRSYKITSVNFDEEKFKWLHWLECGV